MFLDTNNATANDKLSKKQTVYETQHPKLKTRQQEHQGKPGSSHVIEKC